MSYPKGKVEAFAKQEAISGLYIARGQRGQLPPPGKLNFFPNIVFEFAELFLVAILVRNHKKID